MIASAARSGGALGVAADGAGRGGPPSGSVEQHALERSAASISVDRGRKSCSGCGSSTSRCRRRVADVDRRVDLPVGIGLDGDRLRAAGPECRRSRPAARCLRREAGRRQSSRRLARGTTSGSTARAPARLLEQAVRPASASSHRLARPDAEMLLGQVADHDPGVVAAPWTATRVGRQAVLLHAGDALADVPAK